jgi:hypothetical protein
VPSLVLEGSPRRPDWNQRILELELATFNPHSSLTLLLVPLIAEPQPTLLDSIKSPETGLD